MAAFGDAILSLLRKDDPRQAILAQLGGQGSTPVAGDRTQGGAATGGGTAAPAAASQPAQAPASQPEAYQSPPQLVDLYMKLADRQRKSDLIDRGIGLVGASLAQEQNRAGILSMFGGGGGENPADFISTVMDAQKQNQELAAKAAQRAALPAIASKYGLDLPTAQYLFDTGKLDSVIAEAEKADNQLVQGNDGKYYLVDKKTGSFGEGIGPEKEREIELVDDPATGGKIAVYKDTKERVGKNDIAGTGATNAEQELSAANRAREARGEPPLTLEQWKRIGNTQTVQTASNVDLDGTVFPDPPTDTVWARDEKGAIKKDERGVPISEPIKGSKRYDDAQKAAAEAADAAAAGGKRTDARVQTADIVTDDISRLKTLISNESKSWLPVTGVGSYLSGVRGTDAYNAEGLVTTIKANLGFDKLQAMREASPTGAALGPVSDFENTLLQSVMGNLDLGQDESQVVYNLDRINEIYKGIIEGRFVTKGPDGTTIPNQEEVRKVLQKSDINRVGNQEMSDDDIIKKWLPK